MVAARHRLRPAALVTGGSTGIGLATAQEFHSEGARVAICGRSRQSLDDARTAIGSDILPVQADVAKLSDLDAMFVRIKNEFGLLDVVFVNAGFTRFQPFEEGTEETFDEQIAANLKGAFFTIQRALPLLRPGASIIINASVVRQKGWPSTVVVGAIKAGLRSFARTIGGELVNRNVRVDTISPGPINTGFFGKMGDDAEAAKSMLAHINPSKRLGTPSEVAKLVLYLASDDSAYVVGADFEIDGGVGSI